MFQAYIIVSEVRYTQAAKNLHRKIALVLFTKKPKSLSICIFSLILTAGPKVMQIS